MGKYRSSKNCRKRYDSGPELTLQRSRHVVAAKTRRGRSLRCRAENTSVNVSLA
ncbi:unnamed protein product [Ixodes pacificus]